MSSVVVLVAPGNPCKTALRSGLSEIKEYVSISSPRLEFWLFLSSSVLVVVVRRRPSSVVGVVVLVLRQRRRESSFLVVCRSRGDYHRISGIIISAVLVVPLRRRSSSSSTVVFVVVVPVILAVILGGLCCCQSVLRSPNRFPLDFGSRNFCCFCRRPSRRRCSSSSVVCLRCPLLTHGSSSWSRARRHSS